MQSHKVIVCFDFPKRAAAFAQYDNKNQAASGREKTDLARIGIFASGSWLNLNQIPHIPSIFNPKIPIWTPKQKKRSEEGDLYHL